MQEIYIIAYSIIFEINSNTQMEPKKDFSTAILDQKKAPNKLIVNFY